MKIQFLVLLLCIQIVCISSLFARIHPRLRVDIDDVQYFTYDTTNFRVQISTPLYGVDYASFTVYYGDGSNLTGITSGIDLNEDGSTEVSGSTFTNYGYGLNLDVSSTITVDSTTLKIDIDTDTDTQNASNYDHVIGTYTATGIDYVCDGTADEVQFQAVADIIAAGESIWVLGGEYNFDAIMTFTQDKISIHTVAAVINVNTGLTSGAITITGDDSWIRGFKFEGNDANVKALDISGALRCVVDTLTFNEFGTSTGITLDINTASHQAIVRHIKFLDCNTANPLYIRSSYNTLFDIKYQSCKGGVVIAATAQYNLITLYASRFSKGFDMVINGHNNSIQGAVTYTDDASDGDGYSIVGDKNMLSGINVASTSDNEGVKFGTGADDNTLTDSVFNNIGLDGSNAYNGVEVGGDRNTIIGVHFTGTQDKYPIEVLSSADSTIIMGCNSTSATGSIANTFLDNGTNTQILNNLPSTIKNKLRNDTTCYQDLTVNGTFYYNSSSAFGYVTDTTVLTTGTTTEFIILNATWNEGVTSVGFTISGASATYIGSAPKRFDLSGSFSAESDINSTLTYWTVYKNGIQLDGFIIDRLISVQASVGAMSITGLVDLVKGDILDIRVASDKAANIIHRFVSFKIEQIN